MSTRVPRFDEVAGNDEASEYPLEERIRGNVVITSSFQDERHFLENEARNVGGRAASTVGTGLTRDSPAVVKSTTAIRVGATEEVSRGSGIHTHREQSGRHRRMKLNKSRDQERKLNEPRREGPVNLAIKCDHREGSLLILERSPILRLNVKSHRGW